MSRRSSRRNEGMYSTSFLNSDLIGDVGLNNLPTDYNDQMLNGSSDHRSSSRFVMSPAKSYQSQPTARQRGRKGHHHHQQQQQTLADSMMVDGYSQLKQEFGSTNSMLPAEMFASSSLSHEYGVAQTMEVGDDPQGTDVIMVSNMLKHESGVLDANEMVGSQIGNEIEIDSTMRHSLGLGLSSNGDDEDYEEPDLVIDTNPIRDEELGYSCHECATMFKSRSSLKKHINKFHNTNMDQEEEMMSQVYSCNACPYETSRRDKLDKHLRKHVAEGYNTSGKKRNKSSAGFPQRMRHAAEEYKCLLCPYKCTIEKAMRKHNKLHSSGTKQFVVKVSCQICGKDRSTEADLRKHMKKHRHGKEFQCDICGFSSCQLKKIIQHRRMHTGEKPHLCPHCTYRSSRRDNLRSHVRRMHKKENMYIDTFNPKHVEVGQE